MTVGELKKYLEKRPDGEIVVLAMDVRFSPLEEAIPFVYDHIHGDINEEFDVADDEQGWLEGRYEHAVVLWP